MNFDYNEEQQLLADSVKRFIGKDYDFESRKKLVACNCRVMTCCSDGGLESGSASGEPLFV